MLKKRKCLYAVLIVLVVLLSGCGKTSAKSEKEIIRDLQNSSDFFPYQKVTITDSKIIKRQTAPENKTDVVYLTVDASNEAIDCTLSYVMTYTLYNEGWILEGVREYRDGERKVIPKVGQPDGTADNEMLGYSSFQCIARELNIDKGVYYDYFVFTAVKNYAYMTRTDEVIMRYAFNEYNASWVYDNYVVSSRDDVWDINGTWTGNAIWGWDYKVKIDSYDGNTMMGEIDICDTKVGHLHYNKVGAFDAPASESFTVGFTHTYTIWYTELSDTYYFRIKITPYGLYCGNLLISDPQNEMTKIE